jgi:hypothetical protein
MRDAESMAPEGARGGEEIYKYSPSPEFLED